MVASAGQHRKGAAVPCPYTTDAIGIELAPTILWDFFSTAKATITKFSGCQDFCNLTAVCER